MKNIILLKKVQLKNKVSDKKKIKIKNKINNEAESKANNEPKRLDWFLLLFGLILLATRFYNITVRPLHHDETINGWFVMQMWKDGFFRYDPTNYHGPMWFYLLQIAEVFFGDNIFTLRLVPALFNISLLIWVYFWSLPRWTFAKWILLAWALSPGTIFFSRYSIHESVFVFFQVVTFMGVLEKFYFKKDRGFYWIVLGIAGSFLNKETFVITLLSLGISWVLMNFKEWKIDKSEVIKKYYLSLKAKLLKEEKSFFLLGTAIFFFLFFSGFGQRPRGALSFFEAFLPWFSTGTKGMGHEKLWHYWVSLFYQIEWMTLIACIFSIQGFFSKEKWEKAVSLFAWVHLLIYSLIPYKTPWIIVTIQWPFFLSAMITSSNIEKIKYFGGFKRIYPVYWSVIVGFFVLLIFNFYNNIKLNYEENYTQPHAYLYVHTKNDVKNLITLLEDKTRQFPFLYGRNIQVSTSESWPFPWYLRNFSNVHLKKVNDEIDSNPLMIVVDVSQAESLEKQLRKKSDKFWISDIEIRDYREKARVYLDSAVITEKPGSQYTLLSMGDTK